MRLPSLLAAASLLSLSPAFASVTISVLTDPAQIAAFQAGATVQTFENVTGTAGVNISAFTNGQTVGAAGQHLFQSWGGGPGFITTSGGAAAVGLYNLTGGLTGASSGTHVIAPLDQNGDSCFDSTCLMAFEIMFSQAVSRVGFYMNAPASTIAGETDDAVNVNTTPPANISRVNATQLFAQTNIGAGFIAITSTANDINGVSILPKGKPLFLDDVTFSRSSDTGGGNTSTPEPATFAVTGIALTLLGLRCRKR